MGSDIPLCNEKTESIKHIVSACLKVNFLPKFNIENAMIRLGSTCTGCCGRTMAVTNGTYIPQPTQENDKYKIL